MSNPPKFSASKFERALIQQIAKRAIKHIKANKLRLKYDQRDAEMDLEACHCNGTPLDLNKLLAAPDDTFGHDTLGIRRFLDRRTGKIPSHEFCPRCAMPD